MSFSPNSALREKIILGCKRACGTPISTICPRYFFFASLDFGKNSYSRTASWAGLQEKLQ